MQRTTTLRGQELVKKLGIKPGQSVAVLNAPPFIKGILGTMMPSDVHYQTDLSDADRPDVVLFWLDDSIDLASAFADLRQRLQRDGAVWAVIPKKPVADRRGPKVYFADLLAAVLPTGLVDNKTLTLSEEEYTIRFVIRKELRKVAPWESS